MTNTDTTRGAMDFVMTILAIGTTIAPIIFGFALWKMSQVFVSKEQFNDWKEQSELERGDVRKRLTEIETAMRDVRENTVKLLERTKTMNGNIHE